MYLNSFINVALYYMHVSVLRIIIYITSRDLKHESQQCNMFYIQYPKCHVPLHIVEDCVFARFEYLKLLHEDRANDFDGKFEYLFEDSVYDNVGHFTLRLIASTCQELCSYWLIRERKLLRYRLDHLLPQQVHRLFRKILRHVRSYNHGNSMYIRNALLTVSGYFLIPQVFTHITEKEHDDDCTLHSCKINFQSVPDLVKDRRINLDNGYVVVPCSMWKVILESLFNALIENEYKYSKNDMKAIVELDVRLNSISQRIRSQVMKKKIFQTYLTTSNIDNESQNFPLCMQHLHRTLRERHRLSHYARFYYSLFLKECGMDLDNAVSYWRDEYLKPHSCSSGCTHDWQTNEKKFVYSIRHLYGLEGAKKNYQTPNCKAIHEQIPGPRYEGGCPFKNFETSALTELLDAWSIVDDVKKEIIKLGKNQPEIACGLFQRTINITEKQSVIYSPVQYYFDRIKSEAKDN